MDTATFEILPVGSSPVRDPYFAFWENGKQTHYSYVNSWDEGLDNAFTPYAWPGGYEIAYYTDGDIVCAECARAHYIETGERLAHDILGDNYGTGESCGWCNAVIREPGCADCGNTWADTGYSHIHEPVFLRINGDVQICATCMARLVLNGQATKTGKLTYDIAYDRQHLQGAPWYGPGTYTATR